MIIRIGIAIKQMYEHILSLFISMVYINISHTLDLSQFQMIWGAVENMKKIMRLSPVDNMIYVECIVGIYIIPQHSPCDFN